MNLVKNKHLLQIPNNIVSTQRAIAAYVEGPRVSGGGSNASTNTLNVGQITALQIIILTTASTTIPRIPKNDNKRWSRWALFTLHVFFP